MHVWSYTLASVAIVSLISLIGVITLILKRDILSRILLYLVSFAVGGLFGDAFIHLLPETFKQMGFTLIASLLVMGGVVAFFALEKFIYWRHCHVEPGELHAHPLVTMNLIGDAAHNLVDGMAIGASYSIDVTVGLATTFAVILHEIPHEMGNFGVFLHGGLSIKKALAYNFFSALAAVVGAIFALLIGAHVEGFATILIPITAGGFIYVAGSDIIPELKHDVALGTSFWQLLCIICGVGMMALLVFVE